jgi:hypothetical protein
MRRSHGGRLARGFHGAGIAVSLLIALLAGCGGGDGGTDPSSGLNFPTLNPSVNAAFCVRGNKTVGQSASSAIATSDCDYTVFTNVPDAGYFEVWRIRVATARTVTFSVSAPAFDSYLDVAQLTIANGDVTAVQQLAFNDDTNGDDPAITIDLQPDVDYAAVVSGFNDAAVGSYTLTIQ